MLYSPPERFRLHKGKRVIFADGSGKPIYAAALAGAPDIPTKSQHGHWKWRNAARGVPMSLRKWRSTLESMSSGFAPIRSTVRDVKVLSGCRPSYRPPESYLPGRLDHWNESRGPSASAAHTRVPSLR